MFQEIAEGVYLQPSLLYQTQSLVIEDGQSILCVDPNYFPHEILAARELSERLSKPGGERWLALTHSDFDHIAGAPWFEDFQVLTHASWDLQNEERSRGVMAAFDAEMYIPRARPLTSPIRRDRTISSDGERHGGFLCHHAAGHTRDGLILEHLRSGVLICGDYLSDVEFPFVYVSVLAYERTLERFASIIAERPPTLLVSQHGPVAFGGAAISARLQESRDYIRGLISVARENPSTRPEDLGEKTRGLWRGRIPDALWPRHLENARIALLEVPPR